MGFPRQPDTIADDADDVIAFEVLTHAVGTNGKPPIVRIRIESVVKGTLRCEERDAEFGAPSDEAFYATRDGGDINAWSAEPFAGPELGARLVAVVYVTGSSLSVDSQAQWPDSEERRARFAARGR